MTRCSEPDAGAGTRAGREDHPASGPPRGSFAVIKDGKCEVTRLSRPHRRKPHPIVNVNGKQVPVLRDPCDEISGPERDHGHRAAVRL